MLLITNSTNSSKKKKKKKLLNSNHLEILSRYFNLFGRKGPLD